MLVQYTVPTTVYVDDAWNAFTNGTAITDADLGTNLNQAGVIGVNAFSTIAAAQAAVATGGTIIVNDGSYVAATLANTQNLIVTGTNTAQTVIFAGLNTIAGQNVTIQGASVLDLAAGTVAGLITGTGSLVKTGAGTLTLSGANSYAGGTTVTTGTLASVPGGIGSGTLTLIGGTFNVLAAPTNTTLPGIEARLIAVGASVPNTDATILAALATTPVATRVLYRQNLDFPVDADIPLANFFNTTTANTNTFIALFTGIFTAPTTGMYTFFLNSVDDAAFLWIDRDLNGTFSTAGTAGNELISNVVINNTVTQMVALVAGQSYRFVTGVRDTGGGSGFALRYQAPGGVVQYVNPSVQTGQWSFNSPTLAGASSFAANNVIIGSSGGTIALGNTVTGAAFNGLDLSSGGSLTSTQTLGGGNVRNGIAFNGTIALPASGTTTFNTSSVNYSLLGQVTGGAALSFIGGGTALLGNSTNNYSGITTVSATTTLIATANNALGATSGGTIVANGGQLVLQNGVNYSATESLTLNGTGIGSRGALLNRGNAATYAGAISLASNSEIQAEVATLTLTGGINLNGFTATFDTNNSSGFGAGITVSTTGISGTGNVIARATANKTLVLTLNVASNYSGTTTVTNGGRIQVANSGAFGTSAVNNYLQRQQPDSPEQRGQRRQTPLTIAGGGIASQRSCISTTTLRRIPRRGAGRLTSRRMPLPAVILVPTVLPLRTAT